MNMPVRMLSGVERAAVLMMLVGEEEAAAILQKLDPDEVRKLGQAMFAVADVSEREVGGVLDDFVGKARARTTVGFDPRPQIEAVMHRALGPEKAGNVLARITPVEQAAELEELGWLEPAEIAEMTQTAMRVLRADSRCDGFNIGMNQGVIAGAGVAAHLHQHVVPRWAADSNFFPIVGQVKALPALLGDTRALLADAWH